MFTCHAADIDLEMKIEVRTPEDPTTNSASNSKISGCCNLAESGLIVNHYRSEPHRTVIRLQLQEREISDKGMNLYNRHKAS